MMHHKKRQRMILGGAVGVLNWYDCGNNLHKLGMVRI
jgi:hypothetical protein